MKHAYAALVAGILAAFFCLPASAQTIIDEWNSVKVEPAPTLKPADLDAKTTALLVMDLVKQGCNETARPRCVASIPKIKALIAAAKAKGVTVIWTLRPGTKPEDFLPDVAPPAGTRFLNTQADKFLGTDLEKMLKDKGVTTVIPVGTAAFAAVLFTAGEAALRGFNVVVPVDGMSGATHFEELAVAWILANASTVAQKVTLTKTDMIAYH
jgi:nicotinamidase-related amidase